MGTSRRGGASRYGTAMRSAVPPASLRPSVEAAGGSGPAWPTVVSVDGVVSAADQATIPVLDRGFLYGDSVYEVLWWHRGVLVQERDHLERLAASAARIYLDLPPLEDLRALVARTVAASGCPPDGDAYVRLVVTRGAGELGLAFGPPAPPTTPGVVVIVAPARRPSRDDFERGLRVAVVDRIRVPARALDPAAKTGNYLNNLLALHEARRRGADDAVLVNDRGEVAEASTANVYVVRDGTVETPPLCAGILRGTTRTRVLELCRADARPVVERDLVPSDLLSASEAFLSSSVRGVIPVVAVDGAVLGDGRPGPVTRRVHALFEAAADADAAAAKAP